MWHEVEHGTQQIYVYRSAIETCNCRPRNWRVTIRQPVYGFRSRSSASRVFQLRDCGRQKGGGGDVISTQGPTIQRTFIRTRVGVVKCAIQDSCNRGRTRFELFRRSRTAYVQLCTRKIPWQQLLRNFVKLDHTGITTTITACVAVFNGAQERPGLDALHFGISMLQLRGQQIVVTDCTNTIEAAFFCALMPATIPLTVYFIGICFIIMKVRMCSNVVILP